MKSPENDKEPHAQAEHFARLADFLERLPGITTQSALVAAVARVTTPLKLPTIMAGALHVRGDRVAGSFYFGNWSTDWTTTYMESVFVNDPLVAEARRRIFPFTWSELWAEGDLPQPVRDLIELGKQNGWVDGFAVPIHGPGGYVGLVSFAGGPLALSAADRALLLALAHASLKHGLNLYEQSGPSKVAAVLLTRREAQVMHLVAGGKTDAEIAEQLRLSAATVHGYIEQAKRKLGVRTRAQAITELAMREMLRKDR
jgi:LuxR family quorum sensing-dependent transcriptional regulator